MAWLSFVFGVPGDRGQSYWASGRTTSARRALRMAGEPQGGVEVNWQELERHIQARTQAIWLTEPEDLVRLRNGVIDSGAGSYGQVFTTLLFAQSEVRGLAYYAATAILNLAQDPSFTLEQLKKMARTHFAYRAGFLNYVGLHELGDLYQKYFALLDGLPDREAFVRLTQAIKSYG